MATGECAWCAPPHVSAADLPPPGSRDETFVIADAREDARFAGHPLVAGPAAVRSIACVPVQAADGVRVGALWAMDTRPRRFRPMHLRTLDSLAAEAIGMSRAAACEAAGSWAAAVRSAALGIALVDVCGNVLDANPACARLTGYKREELANHGLRLLFASGSHDCVRLARAVSLEEDAGDPAEYRIVRKDGAPADLRITIGRLPAAVGSRLRVITIEDVTAARRLDLRLQHSGKWDAVARLAGGAAHGFNNLLTIISGYGQLVRTSLDEHDPAQTYLHEILAASDTAAVMAAKLLALSRSRVTEPESLDLNALVREVADSLRTGLPPGIRFLTALAPGTLPVMADPACLAQSIRELVTNAREAMSRGGRIRVRTLRVGAPHRAAVSLRPGKYAAVEVEDTGEGIDIEAQKHLFEPFYSTRGLGRGTGLATVFANTRQCGGDIRFVSERGRGATVTLYLPAADRSVSEPRP